MTARTIALTHERLQELLQYDPETGIFTWRMKRKGVRLDKVAGCINGQGYRVICIDGKLHLAHRLAWFYVYRCWPTEIIDHASRNRAQNNLLNLDNVSPSRNNINTELNTRNKTGIKGVCWDKRKQKYLVQIQFERKHRFVGYFRELSEATEARREAEIKYFRPSA